MLSEAQKQQVLHGSYSIGSQQIARWLERIVELENRVQNLEQMLLETRAQFAAAVREKRPAHQSGVELRA